MASWSALDSSKEDTVLAGAEILIMDSGGLVLQLLDVGEEAGPLSIPSPACVELVFRTASRRSASVGRTE